MFAVNFVIPSLRDVILLVLALCVCGVAWNVVHDQIAPVFQKAIIGILCIVLAAVVLSMFGVI